MLILIKVAYTPKSMGFTCVCHLNQDQHKIMGLIPKVGLLHVPIGLYIYHQ